MSRAVDHDVLVIGAGPAGSVAALALARRGVDVRLVDRARFPRTKVCGCCLNQAALDALDRVGLPDLVQTLGGHPYHRLDVADAGRRATLPLPPGLALSRTALDATLIDAATDRGVTVTTGCSARLRPANDAEPFRKIDLTMGDTTDTITAHLVIDATGLSGRASADEPFTWQTTPDARIGIGAVAPAAAASLDDYSTGSIFMACDEHGYVGLVRMERHQLDIAAAIDPTFIKESGHPAHAVRHILDTAGLPPIAALPDLDWKGTPTLMRRRSALGGYRLFLVGDATGYVEPFTGEGMAWAMNGALLLTPIVEAALKKWTPCAVSDWSHAHRKMVRSRQRTCHLVAAGLRRPWVRRAVVGALRLAPDLSRPITSALNAPIVPA